MNIKTVATSYPKMEWAGMRKFLATENVKLVTETQGLRDLAVVPVEGGFQALTEPTAAWEYW